MTKGNKNEGLSGEDINFSFQLNIKKSVSISLIGLQINSYFALMKVSVIIPACNEEKCLQKLIPYLQKESGKHAVHEIIVADGGSDDHTEVLCKKYGALLVSSAEKGRAVQMNAGAHAASGDVLYFVHADTYPPHAYVDLIIDRLSAKEQAGCFTSIFDWPHPFLRFFNFFSRLPFWFCRGGGQTLFVSRQLFRKLEGYDPQMRIMEEYELISRLRKQTSFAVIRKNAITSARDYRVNGVYRLHLIYAWIFILYAGGASQEKMLAVTRKYVKK